MVSGKKGQRWGRLLPRTPSDGPREVDQAVGICLSDIFGTQPDVQHGGEHMWSKRTTRPSKGLFKQDGKCKTDTSESSAKMSTRVEAPQVGTRDSFTMGKNTVAAAADLWQPSADTAHLPVNPVAPRMTRSYFRSLPPKIPLMGDCPPLLARFLGEIALKTLERVSIVEASE